VFRTNTIRTLDAALKEGKVDLKVWEVERYVINKWDQVAKKDVEVEGDPKKPTAWRRQLAASELWQVKVWLRRKIPQQMAWEELLSKLESNAPVVPKISYPKQPKDRGRYALEIDLFDPHIGLVCYPPESDHSWSIEKCEQFCMWAIERLLALAEPYMPLAEIVWPFGNDFLHTDTITNTTTAGTGQPEATAWHHAYLRAEELSFAITDRLREVAPLTIITVPGNHARQSEFTLGRVLRAYHRRDPNVTVRADASPYKLWEFGRCLIGFEHGHSVRPVTRLQGLMANENKDAWARTSFREWHVGDQHRQSASPILEEQGCSVQFLAGLTPANEWHKLKTYNHQKRGATGFVYSSEAGMIARLMANIDMYRDEPMEPARAQAKKRRKKRK
jgi:hypothetical protein